MSYIRSFVAIDLPQEVKNKLGKYQETLKNLDFDVHWENPPNFHLSLIFLGEVRPPSIDNLAKSLQDEIFMSPFTIQPSHLDYLYKRHGDSILFIALTGETNKLRELYDQVCVSVEHSLKLSTTYRFLPHITLGRVKPYLDQQQKKTILYKLINHQPSIFPKLTVSAVKIMQTDFQQDAAHQYASISTISLSS